MAEALFRHGRRVTYADCTVGNHIYYARYLNLLEEARGALFNHVGTSFRQWQEGGFIFPVIQCQIQFRAAARYDDLLEIQVWLTELVRVRLNFGYRIKNQSDQLIVEAGTSHVCTSLDERPQRLPRKLIESLEPYLR